MVVERAHAGAPGETVRVEVDATPEVQPQVVARLAAELRIFAIGDEEVQHLEAWFSASPVLDSAAPELMVQVFGEDGEAASGLMWTWPPGFESVRPGVIRVIEGYEEVGVDVPPLGDADSPGEGMYAPGSEVGVVRQAITESEPPRTPLSEPIRANEQTLISSGPILAVCIHDGQRVPLPFLPINISGIAYKTDDSGLLSVAAWTMPALPAQVFATYDTTVPAADGGRYSSSLVIVDEVGNARGEGGWLVRRPDLTPAVQAEFSTNDCRSFYTGVEALENYHAVAQEPPPSGGLKIKRWSAIFGTTPYAEFDQVILATDYETDRQTMHHEFAHTFRHKFDGDELHWFGDVVLFKYAREHDGTEIAEAGYAFNEGWAGYWSAAALGEAITPSRDPKFLEWNEDLVAAYLLGLSKEGGPARMLRALRQRGSIHSLYEFEQEYCALQESKGSSFCTAGGQPRRARPGPCPDGYTNDGLTCRKDLAKDSYGRGAGVPMSCRFDQEQDGALCYPRCQPGYEGVGPVCWKHCPSGYTDSGASCTKSSYGRGVGVPMSCRSDQEQDGALCYPRCQSGYEGVGPVCWKRCPSGYADAGASCTKSSYGRGAGVPMRCRSNQEQDGALCYPWCRSGYDGVGPVCWQRCPSGFSDHGLTCFKDIFNWYFKSSYGRGVGEPLSACPGMEKDGALCYPWCRSGYDGVGPVCWQTCPNGFSDFGVGCSKPSYGRGAGEPLSACPGMEKDGALCYPWCEPGYEGVGPVCWQECPAGFSDFGVGCSKPSYGRGVGEALSQCPGMEKDGALCYPWCREGYDGVGPVCWEQCPDDLTDAGVFCSTIINHQVL